MYLHSHLVIELSHKFTPVRPSVYGRMLLSWGIIELIETDGEFPLVEVKEDMMFWTVAKRECTTIRTNNHRIHFETRNMLNMYREKGNFSVAASC